MKLLLILLALALLVYIFVRPILRSKPKSNDKIHSVEEMVECVCCGTYTSIQESILSHGAYFCSQTCLQKGKK